MSDDLPIRQEPPPPPPAVRISDAERERVVAVLRQHCTDGLLTLDEFSDRVGVVYAATTTTDLAPVLADLPSLEPAPLPATTPLAPAPATRRQRAVEWTVSIFGGNQRRGRWRIEGETHAVSIMGGCYLDLREAEVVGHEAIINCYALMGGVDVIVPEGIDVVMEGFSFMGGKSAKIADVPVIPGSPLIRVRAWSIMGGVNVRSKGPSKGRKSRHRELRDEIRDEMRDRRKELRDDMREMHRSRHSGRGMPPLAPPPGVPPPPFAPPRRVRGIDAVAADVIEEWPAVRAQVAPEGTVTIMFSDIEGFTSMCERLGDRAANELLQEHYRLVRDELAKHGGFEVKVHGDGFMVAFSSASRALRCAIAIQERQQAWNREHPDEPMRVRMGLHTGEAIRDADDFLGTTVNLASRIATAARGDEILVSGLLRELCVSTGEFSFDGGSEVELKSISQPHRVYLVQYR